MKSWECPSSCSNFDGNREENLQILHVVYPHQ
jgi:hypothetical protein